MERGNHKARHMPAWWLDMRRRGRGKRGSCETGVCMGEECRKPRPEQWLAKYRYLYRRLMIDENPHSKRRG